MKKTPFPALFLALAFSGCISVLPKHDHGLPQYTVSIPAAKPSMVAIDAAPREIYLVGRVRTAPEAAGCALRTLDIATGLTGRLLDGELAYPPEVTIAAFLRAKLQHDHPEAFVCDGAVAPRNGNKTTVDAWIEKFRFQKENGMWSFNISVTLISETARGEVKTGTLATTVPIETGNVRPTAPEAVDAISKALEHLIR